MESSRESVEVKNLNNIFQQSIEKSVEKDRNISNLDRINVIKGIHKAISSNDVRKKNKEKGLFTDFIQNNKNHSRINKNKDSTSICNSKDVMIVIFYLLKNYSIIFSMTLFAQKINI